MSISCKAKPKELAPSYIEWDHVVMFRKIRDEPDDKSKYIYTLYIGEYSTLLCMYSFRPSNVRFLYKTCT